MVVLSNEKRTLLDHEIDRQGKELKQMLADSDSHKIYHDDWKKVATMEEGDADGDE